jgi:hypothetical protein
MTIKKHLLVRNVVALLAATPLLWIAPPILAQSAPAQDARPVQDSDANRQELARFDQFLDSHREIAEQLRKNPALVNDRNFVEQHQALQTYLQQHPAVREELKENPNAFMRREDRYDSRDIDRRSRDADGHDSHIAGQPIRDHDTTRGELASFDQFLDKHRDVAEQLRKNPGLVNNPQYLADHPELQEYLGTHKNVREEIDENPQAFMSRENRFDNRQDAQAAQRDDDRDGARDVAQNDNRDHSRDLDSRDNDRDVHTPGQPIRDHDTTRGELASFDQFMDKHREIAEQLRKNPGLVNNQQFLNDHPSLQEYLGTHKNVREEIDENPQAFMHQEAGYDRNEGGQRNEMDRERAGFGEFLHSHSAISEQLSKNPSLVKNREFMATHPELQDYLKAHPVAQAQLTQNPEPFIKSAQQFNATAKTSTTTSGSVKTTTPDATKPPKQ